MREFFNKLKEKMLITDYCGNTLFLNKILLTELQYDLKEITNIKHLITDKNFNFESLINNIDKETILEFKPKYNNPIKFKITASINNYNGCNCIFILLEDYNNTILLKDDLKKLLDNSFSLGWIKDLNGKYIYVNNALASCFETNQDDCINKTSYDFFTYEYAKKITSKYDEISNSKNPIIFNDTFLFNTGKEQHLQISLFPILDDNKNIKYYGGLAKNLTIDKQFELDIIQIYSQLNTINNLLEQNNTLNTEFKLLNKISDNILNSLKCDEFHVWLYNNDSLIPYCSSDYNKLIKNFKSITIPKSLFNSRIQNFKNWGLNNINDLPSNLLHEYYKKSMTYLCVQPIIYNNEFIGLLHIGYKNCIKSLLHREEFITTLCRQFGMSMYNYTLSENLKKELEKRIATEKELSFLLKTATDITAIISIDGSFSKINDGFTKLLEYTTEEILSKKFVDITHKDDVAIFNEFIDKTIINSLSNNELCLRLISKNGDIKWTTWNYSYIENENIIIATGRDITDEKKLETEKKLMEEALQLESIKNEFFANISHEFKTPLNIILASLQVIAKNIDNENIIISNNFNFKKYTNSIKQNSYRLLRLANNLIDITKIDTGYYEIHPKNCNIVSIIEDITISVAQYMQDKGIDLIFDTTIEELIISCDPDKIERIMLNLLSNAVKYTKSPGRISVNLDTMDDYVIISVKDNGIGISRENLPTIFERFMQVDDTLTRKCEGSGIGLSLVKSLVEMHGGKIGVYSIEEIGSEFTFTLPKITIPNSKIIYDIDDNSHTRIEKCNIEFSDIYSLQ